MTEFAGALDFTLIAIDKLLDHKAATAGEQENRASAFAIRGRPFVCTYERRNPRRPCD